MSVKNLLVPVKGRLIVLPDRSDQSDEIQPFHQSLFWEDIGGPALEIGDGVCDGECEHNGHCGCDPRMELLEYEFHSILAQAVFSTERGKPTSYLDIIKDELTDLEWNQIHLAIEAAKERLARKNIQVA